MWLIAALAGCGPTPIAPTTDTPATTPTATTSTPSTSAPPTPEALSTPTVDPLLPTAEPLTRGLLATTDASWLMVMVMGVSDPNAHDGRSATATYLIDPTGVRYQLPDLPGSDQYLLQWLPGTAWAWPAPPTTVAPRSSSWTWRPATTTPVDLEGIAAEAGLTGVNVQVTFVGDGNADLLVSMFGGPSGLSERRTLDGTVTASADGPAALTRPRAGGSCCRSRPTCRSGWTPPR